MADVIAEPYRTSRPELVRQLLWPTLAPKELREERGLWDGPAHKVLRDGNEVAVFYGIQRSGSHLPDVAMFNLTRDVGEYEEGSTVTADTLARLGYSAPKTHE